MPTTRQRRSASGREKQQGGIDLDPQHQRQTKPGDRIAARRPFGESPRESDQRRHQHQVPVAAFESEHHRHRTEKCREPHRQWNRLEPELAPDTADGPRRQPRETDEGGEPDRRRPADRQEPRPCEQRQNQRRIDERPVERIVERFAIRIAAMEPVTDGEPVALEVDAEKVPRRHPRLLGGDHPVLAQRHGPEPGPGDEDQDGEPRTKFELG